jgi:hypothetical protein
MLHFGHATGPLETVQQALHLLHPEYGRHATTLCVASRIPIKDADATAATSWHAHHPRPLVGPLSAHATLSRHGTPCSTHAGIVPTVSVVGALRVPASRDGEHTAATLATPAPSNPPGQHDGRDRRGHPGPATTHPAMAANRADVRTGLPVLVARHLGRQHYGRDSGVCLEQWQLDTPPSGKIRFERCQHALGKP